MSTLNFAEKPVQVLTLEELERSYHENLPTGQPVGGIYHFELIGQVLEAFERRSLKPVVQEIFAAANRDSKRPGVTLLPQLEEKYGERAVEAHLLNSSQINETAENLLALFTNRGQSPSTSHSGDSPQPVSYWDAYQQLNTVLKPARMDIPQVLPQSLALFECLTEMIK